MRYLFLDPCPDDSGHLVAIDVNYWLRNLNFLEACKRSLLDLAEHF
jgi:hypothetical protein